MNTRWPMPNSWRNCCSLSCVAASRAARSPRCRRQQAFQPRAASSNQASCRVLSTCMFSHAVRTSWALASSPAFPAARYLLKSCEKTTTSTSRRQTDRKQYLAPAALVNRAQGAHVDGWIRTVESRHGRRDRREGERLAARRIGLAHQHRDLGQTLLVSLPSKKPLMPRTTVRRHEDRSQPRFGR